MLHPAARWSDWVSGANVCSLGAGVVFGALALAGRGSRRARSELHAMDAGSTLVGLALLALAAFYSPPVQRPELSVAVALAITLVLRAILVPSRWQRTARISALSSMPAIAVAYFVHANQAPEPFNLPVALYPAITLVWASLAVATASLASRVIFGLRKRAEMARRLGQYVIGEKLGEGGMGIVYRASHAMLCRPTAVKLLDASASGESLARFEREVKLTSRLTHPNTIAIYDYGRTSEGIFYYAMELIEGLTLDDLVRRAGPLPPGRVVHLLRQVCSSLAEAHDAGLVHRDVKPANVLVCERAGAADVVKVLDFGLVKELGTREKIGETGSPNPDADATLAGTVMGTPLYLSPEAIRTPERVDARSDLYAVGCLGYFLLTGTEAFAAPSVALVLKAHLRRLVMTPSQRLEDVTGAHAGVPQDLEALILACLEVEPEARPPSARALARELAACAATSIWTEAQAATWWSERDRAAHVAPANGLATTLAVDWSSRVTMPVDDAS